MPGALGTRRIAGTVAVVATVAAFCSSCAAAQPKAETDWEASAPVEILVNKGYPEQRILAEIYRQTLRAKGRSAELVQESFGSDADRLDSFLSGHATLMAGCTGNMFAELNPVQAHELEQDYQAAKKKQQEDQSGTDYLERTHIGMMGALPSDVTTVDPSSTEACEDYSEVSLPQNIVPLVRKDALNREERNAVTSVTKFLTQEDLQELNDAARGRGGVEKAVGEWMKTSLPGADNGGGEDSDKSDGSGSGLTGGGSSDK